MYIILFKILEKQLHHWGERSWNENFPAGSKSRNFYYNIKWFLHRWSTNSSFKWAKNLHYIYEKCSDNKIFSYDQHILRSFESSHPGICLKAESFLSAFSRIWTKTEDLEWKNLDFAYFSRSRHFWKLKLNENKQLQYTYCLISQVVKAIRQWNLEYNMRNIFVKESYTKCDEEIIFRQFSKNSK